MDKKDSNLITYIIIIIIIMFLIKGCELPNPEQINLENGLDEQLKRSTSSRLITETGWVNITLLGDIFIDLECIDVCGDIWIPCFDDCDIDFCDDYYNCRGNCYNVPNECWQLDNCRLDGMTARLECHLECGFWFEGGYDIETELEIMEIYPWINDTTSTIECRNICDNIYYETYANCFDEFGLECVDCINTCDSTDCFNCEDTCEEGAIDCIIPACVLEEETVLWDGRPITELGSWFETSFPGFYNIFQYNCEGDYFDGRWMSTNNEFGCVDADLFYYDDCEEAPLLSAKEVCETIDGTWICDAECDSDECDEPNATITCNI